MDEPEIYVAITIPTRLIVLTLEEFILFPQAIYGKWETISFIIGEEKLVRRLRTESGLDPTPVAAEM